MANRKTKRQQLLERAPLGLSGVEGNVIKGVKLLGRESTNLGGTLYTDRAWETAKGLYEGAAVNVDHPEGAKGGAPSGANAGKPRSVASKFGKLQTVEVRQGEGVFGDLVYNPKHPLADSIKWFAEHMPDALGFSHHAYGRTRKATSRDPKGFSLVVETIEQVKSVDLVNDSATTKGFFEQVSDCFTPDNLPDELTGQMLAEQVDNLSALASSDTMPTEDKAKALLDAVAPLRELCETLVTPVEETEEMEWKDITLETLKANRRDLVTALKEEQDQSEELETLKRQNAEQAKELDALKAKQALTEQQSKRKDEVDTLLTEAKLPEPLVTDLFRSQLMEAKDSEAVKALIEERQELAKGFKTQKPKSKETSLTEQAGSEQGTKGTANAPTGADFKAALLEGKGLEQAAD